MLLFRETNNNKNHSQWFQNEGEERLAGHCCAVMYIRHSFVILEPIIFLLVPEVPRGYSPKIPLRVCAAQRGCDFGTPVVERSICFRDDFQTEYDILNA